MVDIATLEELVVKYPWYSLGHLELYRQMNKRGKEHGKAYLNIVASHIYSRTVLYQYDNFFREDFTLEPVAEIVVNKAEKPFYIIGGEYFSKDDFESVKFDQSHPVDKFIIEKPSISKVKEEFSNILEDINSADIFEDDNFYTETLAKIYSEQGFYKRAIDIYAKLILLYPEKSAYFAALAQELKSKNNN